MGVTARQAGKPKVGPYRWKDFVALDEDDLRELENGELVEGEMPTKEHEWALVELQGRMYLWARRRAAGYLMGSGYKVRIGAARGVMPDLQFFAKGNEARAVSAGVLSGHPDIVVEIISHSPSDRRRDWVRKQHDYARIGVPEYWIIDPEAHALVQLVLKGGHYTSEQALADDDVFRPKSCKGLVIPLAKLWLPEPAKRARKRRK